MSLRIEDYALIGDCQTAALVGNDGSIDWLCLPRFDSPACFASLVGSPDNGHWRIAPKTARRTQRRYRGDTLVLETEIETDGGSCCITDFMDVAATCPTLVRIVTGMRGKVELDMSLVIRFDYGRLVPWVSRRGDCLVAVAGPHLLSFHAPVAHRGEGLTTVASFTAHAGEEIPFVLSYGISYRRLPPVIEAKAALAKTEDWWHAWVGHCSYEGPWRAQVVRSLITLKALTHSETGGIIAAPTTSLPEKVGGERNWDYRYCWLRDATFTLLSLMRAGYREEADAWRAWLVRAAAGVPAQMQPVYNVLGENRLDEWRLTWLDGYRGSKPVRVGNEAYAQLQLDTYGEVIDAMHHGRRHKLDPDHDSWAVEKALLAHLETLLGASDHGIWEFRGDKQHFTHSKVMMWVAFDRAVSAVNDFGLDGPVEHWRSIRDALHKEICDKAYDPGVNAFMQSYGSKQLDAATLLLPMLGFLPTHDPRIKGTVAAIEKRLLRDGLVLRYDTAGAEDGLPEGEGAFLPCTFWYIDNLAMQGRYEEGRRLFERLLGMCNDVGLLAEEYDGRAEQQLGNFPQALSHLALIGTAYNLSRTRGIARERSKHEAAPGARL